MDSLCFGQLIEISMGSDPDFYDEHILVLF